MKWDVRINNKTYVFCFQSHREVTPFLHRENHTKMRDGYTVTIRGVKNLISCTWLEVRNDLVPVTIEIYPRLVTAPFRKAKKLAIEFPRADRIVYRKRKMKQCD